MASLSTNHNPTGGFPGIHAGWAKGPTGKGPTPCSFHHEPRYSSNWSRHFEGQQGKWSSSTNAWVGTRWGVQWWHLQLLFPPRELDEWWLRNAANYRSRCCWDTSSTFNQRWKFCDWQWYFWKWTPYFSKRVGRLARRTGCCHQAVQWIPSENDLEAITFQSQDQVYGIRAAAPKPASRLLLCAPWDPEQHYQKGGGCPKENDLRTHFFFHWNHGNRDQEGLVWSQEYSWYTNNYPTWDHGRSHQEDLAYSLWFSSQILCFSIIGAIIKKVWHLIKAVFNSRKFVSEILSMLSN